VNSNGCFELADAPLETVHGDYPLALTPAIRSSSAIRRSSRYGEVGLDAAVSGLGLDVSGIVRRHTLAAAATEASEYAQSRLSCSWPAESVEPQRRRSDPSVLRAQQSARTPQPSSIARMLISAIDANARINSEPRRDSLSVTPRYNRRSPTISAAMLTKKRNDIR
jgi:hypothetical protein